jgi:signal transduction histidine kinase
LLQNLLGNALKYRSGADPVIDIWSEPRGNYEAFAVRDNGIGIPPQYQEQIFGMFKRLHGQRYPGTGIGLAICQRIVEGYGGRIWVESDAGKGATFWFTLPGGRQSHPAVVAPAEEPVTGG